jgi:hypothetical protein
LRRQQNLRFLAAAGHTVFFFSHTLESFNLPRRQVRERPRVPPERHRAPFLALAVLRTHDEVRARFGCVHVGELQTGDFRRA